MTEYSDGSESATRATLPLGSVSLQMVLSFQHPRTSNITDQGSPASPVLHPGPGSSGEQEWRLTIFLKPNDKQITKREEMANQDW